LAYNLLVLLGPTASGKTRLGAALARQTNGEIISADSRQVYRGLDIGSGKDLHEYGDTPYHLIDIVEPSDEFNLFLFQRLFLQSFNAIGTDGKLAILVGGTGLYLDAVLQNYTLVEVPENQALRDELADLPSEALVERLQRLSPKLHNSTDLLKRERLVRGIEIASYQQDHPPEPLPDISPLVMGIRWERQLLKKRITDRLKERLAGGMIEEVAALHASGIPWSKLDFFGLEYRYAGLYLQGEINRNDLFQKLNSAIHDFAKRQESWFRRMERQGINIHWLEGAGDPYSEAIDILRKHAPGLLCKTEP
jgi:tRNA dimethylallyltransferase